MAAVEAAVAGEAADDVSQLDVAMRVVFPITYGSFCIVMFSIVDQYGTNENGCVTIAN